MNPNAAFSQCLDCCAHIHCIPAQSIELGYDQYIAFFHLK